MTLPRADAAPSQSYPAQVVEGDPHARLLLRVVRAYGSSDARKPRLAFAHELGKVRWIDGDGRGRRGTLRSSAALAGVLSGMANVFSVLRMQSR
jgi:hypothetical protein